MLTSEEYSRARDLGWESSGPNDGTYDNLLILAKVLNRVNEYGQPVMQYGTGSNGIFFVDEEAAWQPDGDGRYTTATNPYHNGTINPDQTAIDPVSGLEGRVIQEGICR
jgi:hemoglobin/transferrin/lactoferrin receptor protein